MATEFDSLVVPAAFARYDRIADTAVLTSLYAWKSNTEPVLNRLDSLNVSAFSISELANLVCILAPLTAVARWTSSATRSLASAHLARIPPAENLITHILTQVVKPLFAPTPHPRLHTTTARILARPANVQDTYIEQPWKERPGLDEIIRWCLLNTQSLAYESAWPFILPPVMSFLDDYQVAYKLLGVCLVSDMLTCASPDLLLRTGVEALMFNSLINSLSHLGDQSTPDFIRLAVTTTLQLIDLTTPSALPIEGFSLRDKALQSIPATALTHTMSLSRSGSLSTRFSRISTLLSSTLLGSVIVYTPTFLFPASSSASSSDPFVEPQHVDMDPLHIRKNSSKAPRSFNPTLVAAAEALPSILSALGIGSVRFLKGIIPVLAEWLGLPLPVIAIELGNVPSDDKEIPPHDAEGSPHRDIGPFTADITLHLASLSSLSIVFHTCTSRVKGWSTTIINALGRCWVECLDIETQKSVLRDNISILKKQLKEIIVELAEVCPGVVENEYATLLAYDKALFRGLVGEIQ